ncbi:natural killer cells antigen CD94-like [Sorex fumeus]|uniref:natural killer cells antigen CD94-like n=1 Tax=Sorex fumeus TaxID=62283 RepID=UPI0024AD881F|nr:natural killer cells antigen CD94-like [Sorex fumeus]
MAAPRTIPWKWISGILGVLSVLLVATVGILLKKSFLQLNIQLNIKPTIYPGLTEELQKGSGCCSCQEKWIGYKGNCYFISDELKIWVEKKYGDLVGRKKEKDLTANETCEVQEVNQSKRVNVTGNHGEAGRNEKTEMLEESRESMEKLKKAKEKKVNQKSFHSEEYPVNGSSYKETNQRVWNYTCSRNWHQHGENCYHFSKTALPGEECEAYCMSLFSRFLKVITEEEMELPSINAFERELHYAPKL